MKIKFDFAKLSVIDTNCFIRSISRSTINPVLTVVIGGEIKKFAIPASVGRRLIQTNKNNQFDVDFPIHLVMYDGKVMSADLPTFSKMQEWRQDAETFTKVCANRVERLTREESTEEWFFDGTFVYQDTDVVVKHDDQLYATGAVGYNLHHIGYANQQFELQNYTCYAGMIDGELYRTSPIVVGSPEVSVNWFQLVNNIDLKMKYELSDRFDKYGFPNLRWVNYSSKLISKEFGMESIEGLALPLHVIDLRTFNLSKVPGGIQNQTPSTMTSCQAFFWILGLYHRSTTLVQVEAAAKCLRMLRNKGYTLSVESGSDDVDIRDVDGKIRVFEKTREFCDNHKLDVDINEISFALESPKLLAS